MENNMNNAPQKPLENGIGPVIGSAIVIMVVVIGGFYFWGGKLAKERHSAEIQNQAMVAPNDIADEEDVNTEGLNILDDDLNQLNEKIANPEQQ